MSGVEQVPDWAIERALDLMSNGHQPSLSQCKCRPEYWTAQINVARYIAAHEEKPDPVEVEVARLLPNANLHPLDVVVRNALKRGIELAKTGGAA